MTTFRFPRRHALAPWFVLALSLIASAAATGYVARSVREHERLQFANAVETARAALIERIDAYVATLRAGSALFAAGGPVTRDVFHRWAEHLELQEHFPGVQGIGFSARVAGPDLAPLVRRMRAEGDADFHVWPDGPRREVHAILYLEPLDRRNRTAIGYDMYSDPVRRAAMERARDTGRAAATGKVTLVQEIAPSKQAGFLIYVPVYRDQLAPESVAARRAKLVGFVYSPFRTADLLRGIFRRERTPRVDVTVFDGDGTDPADLLYEPAAADARHAWMTARQHLDVAGRRWTLQFTTRPAFEAAAGRGFVPMVAVTGGAFSLLLFLVAAAQARARLAAEATAGELRETEGRLRAETEALTHARAAAEHASRLKDEFLATVSHELRTPLAAIFGWTQALRRNHRDEAQLARGLETIERNVRLQTQLVSDLLDVSRIVSGKMRLELRPLQPATYVDSVIETVRPGADAKGVAIEAALDRNAGPVLADPARLQQILWNLLSNAVKFTPAGGRIRVSLARRADAVVLAVEDTGIGIGPDFLPFVFDRFRQVDSSTTRRHGGLGLGLAIVRHLVELHGGTVRAESAGEGRGARFVVALPRAAALAAPATEPAPALPSTPVRRLRGVRVLVVDDEPDGRDVVKSLLEDREAEVVTAPSVRAALAAVDDFAPDVVVSDIGMPGEDGYALIRALRARGPERGGAVPAIALTAFARAEDSRRAHRAGFQIHLAKPVDDEELVASIADLAHRRAG